MRDEPWALNGRMDAALRVHFANFSPEVLQPFSEEQRYGYKGLVRIRIDAEAYDLTSLAIWPAHGTGQAEPRLGITNQHRFPRNHDENSHEWVISLEDEPNMEIHYIALSPTLDTLSCGFEEIKDRVFTSHRTLYMAREELFANPAKPHDLVVRVSDVHALYNPTDGTQLLLVYAAKKGVPLNMFHERLVKRAGGVESYLLQFNEKTHEIEPRKDLED